jgi:FKBP-type peptidyl-prolyl cis-trans isomerase FklB
MNNRHSLYLLLSLLFLALTSCQEKNEASEYDNWQQRNDAYIDSIARVCRANADGRWVSFRAFDLGTPIDDATDANLSHYIYVHKESDGTGSYKPLYTDSVRVHYSGRIIPSESYPQGYNFNRSYYGYTLDEATDVPALLGVGGTVKGFCTALMQMVEGDTWRVYIPYELGYGGTAQSSGIPAYSTLIFDMKLARVYKYKVDTNTKWW